MRARLAGCGKVNEDMLIIQKDTSGAPSPYRRIDQLTMFTTLTSAMVARQRRNGADTRLRLVHNAAGYNYVFGHRIRDTATCTYVASRVSQYPGS